MPSTLTKLARVLEAGDFSVAHTPASETVPAEVLMIAATVIGGAVIPLRFIDLNDMAAVHAQPDDKPEPSGTECVLGSVVFPFLTPPERHVEVMRAILVINRLLPLCSFGFSEADGACYLQAAITTDFEAEIPVGPTHDIVGLACDAARRYSPMLQGLASGEITYAQFTETMHSAGLVPPPLLGQPGH